MIPILFPGKFIGNPELPLINQAQVSFNVIGSFIVSAIHPVPRESERPACVHLIRVYVIVVKAFTESWGNQCVRSAALYRLPNDIEAVFCTNQQQSCKASRDA